MARSGTAYGSAGGGGRRPFVNWTLLSQSVANNTSTIRFDVGSQPVSGYSTWGTFSGILYYSGGSVGVSGPVTQGASNTIASVTRTISHDAAGYLQLTIGLSGSIPGTSGWKSTSLNGSAGVDQIVNPPAQPWGLGMARNASRGVTLTWRFGDGGAARTAVEPWRRENGGAWKKLAVLGKDVTSYVDSGISETAAVEYQIRVLSASSYADGAVSAKFYWAAPIPAGLSAVKQVDGSITVTTTSTGLLGIEWYRNGVLAATVGVGAATVASSWVDGSPSSGANVYTAKAFAGGTGVFRGYSALSAPSNVVSTLAKPNPPTNLNPNGGLAAVGPVALSWSHNPTDTTAQTAYELQYRPVGGAWTKMTGTTAQSRAVTFSAPGAYEFQVRTKGSFAEWSDWSAVASFTAVTQPLVSVSSPSDQWISPILKLVWVWSQAQGYPQSSWRVSLKDSGGATVETKSGSGATLEYTFATRLEDSNQYSVLVEAWAGDVAASPDTAMFEVVFVPPAQPVLFGDWDDTLGSHTVTIERGTPAGGVQPLPVRLDLESSVDGGATWRSLVGEYALSGQTTITDWEGLVHGETLYRGIAVAESGASAETVIAIVAESWARWIGAGPSFTHPARLPYTPSTSVTSGRERSTEDYDGRPLPVAYSGEHLQRKLSAGGRLFDGSEDSTSREALEALSQMEGPVFLHRDPDGNHIYGVISDLSVDRVTHTVWDWKLSVVETGRDDED